MAGVKGRSGTGRHKRDPVVIGWRDFCRTVVSDPRVQAKIQETALANPEFALRLAEHGYGRPPQALDVKVNDGRAIVHRVTFGGFEAPPGGHPGVPDVAGVPAADLRLDGTD